VEGLDSDFRYAAARDFNECSFRGASQFDSIASLSAPNALDDTVHKDEPAIFVGFLVTYYRCDAMSVLFDFRENRRNFRTDADDLVNASRGRIANKHSAKAADRV
jgi:hypothetical protein